MGASSDDAVSSAASSTPSLFQEGWIQHVLQKKYRDPKLLKQVLDDEYGEGNYKVVGQRGTWILGLRKQLGESELEQLEEKTFRHY